MRAGAASAYVEELQALSKKVDSFAAIERLCAEPDCELAANTFIEWANRLYAEKDIAGAVAVGRAGIQYCASCRVSGEQRARLRQQAKAMAFNLGANTWPGWGDDGVIHTESDLAAGLDAARLNLRLSRELGRGPLAESKAHWLLGAHWLARGEYRESAAEFTLAIEQARMAGNVDDEHLSRGYIALIGVLRGLPNAARDLARAVDTLEASGTEDGGFYAHQIVTALEIFQARMGNRS